ncbi:PRD domain-containing protein [Marinilactibacillus kalidii]|uniref:PRD domain-containing protein n=1 Tax=Marinilactibacillus kalidii TaxID=2820274 RepID=UPI001ABDB77B|nr:PRD domain-containing protein [Marinilactibacillus kalidii]
MHVKKVLNNSAILVRDENSKEGKDFIWVGGGIGFGKKPGDQPDESKIEKVFVMQQSNLTNRFSELVENIPVEYVSIADDVISYAKEKLQQELSDTIYISLTDHIANLLKLHDEGVEVENALFWEIKKFYPKEFEVAQKSVKMISDKTGKKISESEAGNLALHFINAQLTSGISHLSPSQNSPKKIRDILSLIRFQNKIELDESSIAYDRFVTHLRFFFKRLDLRSETMTKNPLLEQIKVRYTAAFTTMKKIEQYLDVVLDEDEQLYLTLHIQKLIE